MKKQVYKVNYNGYLVEIYVSEVDENGNILDEEFNTLISVDPPHGLLKARWNGSEWIEGATQEEIDELTKVEPSPPTAEERIDALEEALLLMMMEG